MPPKKRQKPLVTIYSEFIDSLPDESSPSVTSPDQISQQQLARAYGLAPPYTNASPQSLDLLRACPPRWSQSEAGEDRKPTPPKETEVIDLREVDDDDDDLSMQKTKVGPAKKVVLKGKGKAKETEFKPRICSHENCNNSPKCLNWLGQDKWENSTQAWKQYRKSMGLPQDPENDREENVPVGLRNLGATCYVNSFLQVWYRDARFRAGVYSCEPPANGHVESSPLFQLQVLFSFLQTSKQGTYDPTPLVNSLKLDQTEQQDAQEFSKLFLSLLDHEFKKQSLKKEQEGATMNVGKLVEEQFEGSMIYGTRCQHCNQASERPASFLELEVSLTKDCKLEKRIEESLVDEKLTGDNKYHCETCNTKRNATRYSELRSLPPVLHFSLLRFIFNLKDFSRAKSQYAISYPLALDMGQYLPANPQTGNKDQVWYDLKGVLMHKGVSAHHGHYVAQVYDEEQSKWFLFDDESVSEVEDLNAPDIYDDEDGDPVIGQKAKKKIAAAKGKGITRDSQGHVRPKSKDAYMLVYTRRPEPSAPKPAEPNPPPLARFEVEKLDAAYQKEIEDWKLTTGNAKEAFEKLRKEKRSVYNSWDVVDEDEEAFLMDKNALKRWVESGLKANPAPKTNGDKKENGHEEEMQDVKPATAESSNGSKSEDVEMKEASASNSKSTSPDITVNHEDSPALSEAETKPQAPLSPKEDSLSPPPASPENGKNGSSKPKIELVKTIDNSSILCPHGHANPSKAEQIKRVSQTAYMTLRGLGVEIEPELMMPRDFCRECVAGIATECYYPDHHAILVEELKPHLSEESDEICYISKPWLLDFQKERPKMHSALTGTDPSPASQPYIGDVLCEHGGLAADVKKRVMIPIAAARVLQKEFPDFDPTSMDPDPCQVCVGASALNEVHTQQLREIQQKEKKSIKSVWDGQMRLGGNRLPLSDDPDAHYVVPREWTRSWWNWTKKTGPKKELPPRPSDVSNDFLLCKHGGVCFDLPKEVETAKTIAIATQDDWRYLQTAYKAGPEIRIWIDRGATEPSSHPRVCAECLDEKRKNFETTNLWVKTLEASDIDSNGQRRAADSPPAVMKPKASTSTSSGQTVSNFYGKISGTRTSARTANKAGILNRKQMKSIEMEKHDKVKDLKLKIEVATGISIISQRVFFNMQELEGSQTVQELGLVGDDTIEVFEVVMDEDLDFNDLQDVDPDQVDRRGNLKRGAGGKKRAREEGFGGTGLTGWDRGQDEEGGGDGSGAGTPAEDEASGSSRGDKRSRSNSQAVSTAMQVDAAKERQISCPGCTFLNDPFLVECEICQTPLGG